MALTYRFATWFLCCEHQPIDIGLPMPEVSRFADCEYDNDYDGIRR